VEAGLTAGSDELASRAGERMKKALRALAGLVVLTACSIQGDPIVGEGPTGQDYPTGPTCDALARDFGECGPTGTTPGSTQGPTGATPGPTHHVPTMTEWRALERRAARANAHGHLERSLRLRLKAALCEAAVAGGA
jgi:hypothetical protein